MGNSGNSPSVTVGEGWGLRAVVPATTFEVGSADVGLDPGEALHPAIRTAIAVITVRSAAERIALVLVMGTRHRPSLLARAALSVAIAEVPTSTPAQIPELVDLAGEARSVRVRDQPDRRLSVGR